MESYLVTGFPIIPGKAIIKLYYWKRIDATSPSLEIRFSKSRQTAIRSNLLAKTSQTNSTSKENVTPGFRPREGGVNPTVALQISAT
jgi:hypothetical protein